MKNSSERIAIGDFATVISGYAFKSKEFQDDGIPIIKIKNIRVGDIDLDDVQFVKEEYLDLNEKYHVESGDILISLTGSHLTKPNSVVGRVAKYSGPLALLNQRAGKITINESNKADKDYLYYTLSSESNKRKLALFASGAASQANISPSQVESVELDLPDLKTQQKIASILSAFDDLIENNTRRIAILEEMARLIYREWFVHYRYPGHKNDRLVDSGTELGEVPEVCGVKTLEDVADLNPENISKDFKGEIEYINISGVDTGKINETEIYNIDDAPGRAKRKVNHGDIIWSSVRPNLKSYALIMNPKPNWIASTGFAVIRPLKLPPSFLYNFVTTDYFVEYLINHARGSAYPAVNVSDFKNAKIVVPPDDLVKKYDGVVWPNFQQIDRLERKNKKLKETRDLLLPKLISGKVGV